MSFLTDTAGLRAGVGKFGHLSRILPQLLLAGKHNPPVNRICAARQPELAALSAVNSTKDSQVTVSRRQESGHPRADLRFLDQSVERFFDLITENRIRRGVFKSVPNCKPPSSHTWSTTMPAQSPPASSKRSL
jgi:hypothetical protein